MNLEHKDFDVIHHITDGGASKIYKIYFNNEICVLKISKDLSYINEVQIDNEIAIHQLISSKSIPTLKKTLRVDGHKAMILSFIKGTNLAYLVDDEKKVFTESETKTIIINLVQIIQQFHNKKPPIILRDIKPSNIIIGDNLEVNIVDFGISTNGNTVTANKAFGTKGFTAKEAYKNGVYGITSDIYSIGATYKYIESGNHKRTKRIIEKCMDDNVDERYQNVSELLSDLKSESILKKIIRKFKKILL